MALTRSVSTAVLLVLLPCYVLCQQARQYTFTHFKTIDGLASTIINNVVQDDKGYIWLSTINGLQRYDGNKFITFRNDMTNPASLPSNDITCIYYESKNNNLWVATSDNRIGIFNTSSFTYRQVPVRNAAPQRVYIGKQIFETADGQLMVLIKGDKLYRYDAPLNRFVADETTIPFPKNWQPNTIIQDSATRKFWISSDSGLVVFNPQTRRMSYAGNNAEQEPAIARYAGERFINYIHIDKKRRLWLEQWIKTIDHPVLHVYDMKAGTVKKYDFKKKYRFNYHEIKAMLEQRNGNTWIFGFPYIAAYRDSEDPLGFIRKEENSEQGITFTDVHCMYEDRQLNVWICTDNGVYLFNPDVHLFDNYKLVRPGGLPMEGRVQTAVQLNNREIWLGSRDLGLFCYDNDFNPLPVPAGIRPHVEGKSVWDIRQHSRTGLIWLAMQGGKIIIYNPATQQTEVMTPPAFEQRAVTQITEDHQGNLWFGTQGGNVVKWNYTLPAVESNFILIRKTQTNRKLFTDSWGYIWVTSFGEGVYRIDPGTNQVVRHITTESPPGYRLWNNAASDILQYNDSLLLVGGDVLNIINLNNYRISHISTRNGLPSNTVLSILKDSSGVLWLGMVNGLCRANLEKNSFTMYYRNDGILNDNFNIGGSRTLLDGRQVFCSELNFVVFHPANLKNAAAKTDVYFTDFKLSEIPLSVDSLSRLDRINLPYNNNSITIEFSALNYYRQNKLTYFYQLEGLNDTWVQSDERHQAIYSYLPPGNYTFRVKTKNIDGVFSDRIASMSIRIHPPFWRTWSFYGFIVLVIIIILYLIDRERLKRLRVLQHVRAEIANKLHDDVSTTLNNVNILSHIARLKANIGDIEKSKEFIDQIEAKSNNMAIAMDDMLWSIDPKNDSMEKTLQRILEYAESLEGSQQAHIDIKLDQKVRQLVLDMKMRYEFLMICKEAFQSLVENTKGKSLLVNIDLARSKILLSIQCQEPGADLNNQQMEKLRNKITNRAAAIGAHLDFVTNRKEMSIILSVPL